MSDQDDKRDDEQNGGPLATSRVERLRLEAKARLYEALVDAAEQLLVGEGPQAVSMRKVAEAIGASSQVVITQFRNKQGLADALFRRGFDRLRSELNAAPTGRDPVVDIAALMAAYRRFALANPALYKVMFGQAFPEQTISQASTVAATRAFAALADVVTAAAAQKAITTDDPIAVAETLWAGVHGVVSLDLNAFLGHPPRGQERFDQLVDALLAGLAHEQSPR